MVAAPPTGRTFQARLTLAFVAVVAISLFAVSAIVVNRLDGYFREQEQAALDARGSVVARISALFAGTAAGNAPSTVQTANTRTMITPQRPTRSSARGRCPNQAAQQLVV